jgi:uncharacterized protein (TIGR00730 family)
LEEVKEYWSVGVVEYWGGTEAFITLLLHHSNSSAMQRICVFCGSSPGAYPEYRDAARQLGQVLAEQKLSLVYGGSNAGLMGAIADAVLEHGSEAIGVIPLRLAEKGVVHPNLSKLHVVDTMHKRKAFMAELSDAFIALPGGIGTIEEFFEAVTWSQLGFHRKPCGLLNVRGYYNHLITFLDQMVAQYFLKSIHRDTVLVDEAPEVLLQKLLNYEVPQVDKWIGREA